MTLATAHQSAPVDHAYCRSRGISQTQPRHRSANWTGQADRGISVHDVLHYDVPTKVDEFADKLWGGTKILWAVDSSVDGAVLVREHRLDGHTAFESTIRPSAKSCSHLGRQVGRMA